MFVNFSSLINIPHTMPNAFHLIVCFNIYNLYCKIEHKCHTLLRENLQTN
jgi:hypothetical protein